VYIVKFDWYVSKDKAKDREYIDACLKESEEVQKEDMWLCERVQKGLQSPAYSKGNILCNDVSYIKYIYLYMI
jgi:choline monooxygenase